MRPLHYVFLAAFCLVAACSSTDNTANQQRLRMISDKQTDETSFRNVITSLSAVETPPKFWNNIADNSKQPVYKRQIAVVQLFEKHFRIGMTLGEMVKLIAGSDWMRQTKIARLPGVLTGAYPINLNSYSYHFKIVPLQNLRDDIHAPVIYFSMENDIPSDLLQGVLQGNIRSVDADKYGVLEMGVTENIDNALVLRVFGKGGGNGGES